MNQGASRCSWTGRARPIHTVPDRMRPASLWAVPILRVTINCHNVFDASLPFGGYKQSGWGREMGEEVFHNYTEIKAVTAAL